MIIVMTSHAAIKHGISNNYTMSSSRALADSHVIPAVFDESERNDCFIIWAEFYNDKKVRTFNEFLSPTLTA